MKKLIYVLILSLLIVSGFVFANREIKNDISDDSTSKPISDLEMKTEKEKWEASPDGKMVNNWKESPAGKKVLDGIAKINKPIKDFSNMEAIVTSLSLPKGSRLGYGIMVKIEGEDYILAFGIEKKDSNNYNLGREFEQLHQLKVNDKIIIRSRSVSYAPKYAYPIVAGDYVEKEGKILYKREPNKDGC
jgi:hypothetical protein